MANLRIFTIFFYKKLFYYKMPHAVTLQIFANIISALEIGRLDNYQKTTTFKKSKPKSLSKNKLINGIKIAKE